MKVSKNELSKMRYISFMKNQNLNYKNGCPSRQHAKPLLKIEDSDQNTVAKNDDIVKHP